MQGYKTAAGIVLIAIVIFVNAFILAYTLNGMRRDQSGVASINGTAHLCQTIAENSDKADPASVVFCGTVYKSFKTTSNCKVPPPPSLLKDDKNISLAKRLISGKKHMQLELEISSDAVFILGNTGSGRTTVTQLLTGSLSGLHATELDNGKMVIFDDDNRINQNTTRDFMRIIPESFLSPDKITVFWDCPGFDSNRKPEMDVAAMYFLQTALHSSTNAKFLFVVSYSSLQLVENQQDFDNLVTSATRLITNLDAVSKSIGLVITKVPSLATNGDYLSDEMILSQIEKFLQIHINKISVDVISTYNVAEKQLLERKQKFVEIFLATRKTLSKIALYRIPPFCGSLQKIPSMITAKHVITGLYQNNIQFATIDPTYFEVPISTQTIKQVETKFIPETIQQIVENVGFSAANVFRQLRKMFYNKLENGNNNATEFVTVHKDMEKFIINLSSSLLTNFTEQFIKFYDIDGIKVHISNKCILQNIAELEHQLDFYAQVLKHHIRKPDLLWIQPLQNLSNQIANILEFYKFCQNVERDISRYEQQLSLSKVISQNPIPVFQDVLQFLKTNNITQISNQIEVLWPNLFYEDVQYLAKLVQSAFPNTRYHCEKSFHDTEKYKLVVSGKYIMLSQFVNSPNFWPTPCSDSAKLKEINIFASKVVFLDRDLIGNCSTLYVSIVAPQLVVIGKNRQIFLGCTGQLGYLESAAAGSDYGDFGKNGKDGQPGINGGSIFGVYLYGENFENLIIIADGGQGGKGQNGGRGSDGKPGKNATFEQFPSALSAIFTKGELIEGCMIPWWHVDFVKYYNNMNDCYTLRGSPGNKGGNGGRGGNSGLRGNPGNILIISLGNESTTDSVLTSVKPGRKGIPGEGGNPGLGSYGGHHYSCGHQYIVKWSDCYATPNGTAEPNGLYGNDGEITEELANQEKSYEWWKVIVNYKKMIQGENSNSNSKFLEYLDQNPNIVSLLTVQTFAEELEFFEKAYYYENTREKQNVIQLYENFLQRLKNFAKIANIPDSGEKVALNYIYVVVLEKIISFRQNANTLNVINTEGYFDALLKQLDTFKEVQKNVAIGEESAKYEMKMYEKIKEAETFVQELVLPALAKAEAMMTLKYDELLKEVNANLRLAEDNVDKQKLIKRQFSNTLPLRALLDGLKLVGAACQFFGPVGKGIGSILTVSTSVAESLLLKPVSNSHVPFSLPAGFTKTLEEQSSKWHKDKVATIEMQISLTLKAIQESEGELDELRDKAEEIQVLLAEVQNSTNAVEVMQKQEKLEKSAEELRLAVKKEEANFESQNTNLDKFENQKTKIVKRKGTTTKIIKRLDKILQMGTTVMKFVQSVNGQITELGKLSKLVEDANTIVSQVEQKKAAIYNEFLPTIEQMGNDIKENTKNLKGKSHVFLSIKRWQVQKMLKDMRSYMTSFANGMNGEEEFQLCVDRMEEAINMLITLYDHIEQYQEKKELADYIANVNSVTDEKAQITDPKLIRIIAKMELALKANLFSEDYQRAMAAFKQWVFPFAANYLTSKNEETQTLITAENQTLQQVSGFYKKKVETLAVQLKKYQATTTVTDQDLIVTRFEGGRVSTRPFYVWSTERWQKSIEMLLTGDEIHLKADPEAEPETLRMLEGKAAVKFKSVELHFRAKHSRLQGNLDDALKHFQMKMTHSGVSIYEVFGQKYVMTDANQTYRYSFERHTNDNQAISKNIVHGKVQGKSDFLMSPYTWWTFQLVDLTPGTGVGFRDLRRRFGGVVDLELVGEGVYLDVKNTDSAKLWKLNLDRYYESVDGNSDYLDRLKDYQSKQC